MPSWKRLCLITPASRFEVGESSTAAAARQTRHTLAYRVDYGFIDTVDASIRASEGRAMIAVEEVNERVTDLATTQRQDAHELQVRYEDAQNDQALLRAQSKDRSRTMEAHIGTLEAQFESLKFLQRQLFRSLEDWEVSLLQFMQRGDQLNAAPVVEVQNFTNWKKSFMCHIIVGQRKPETQWTPEERKAANLNQRFKSLIMYVLLDDQMNSGINGLTAKSTWDDLILYHKGPSNVKENRVMDLKLCYNTFKFKEESELASLFGKLKYEENLINNIYDTNKEKTLVPATLLSTAFFSSFIIQDFQDSPHDEEDTRSYQDYMNDLEEEYQARALLAKSKRFFKKGTQRFSSEKETDQTECHKCGMKGHFARDCWSKTSVPSYQSPFQPKLLHSPEHKSEPRYTKDFEAKYNKVKAKLALINSSASTPSLSLGKNKVLIAETIGMKKKYSIIPLGQKNTLAEYMILSVADNRPPMLDKDLTKKYAELSATEKIQADCDMKATNIILQGLPANIYSHVNHHIVAKDLWERVQLLMQATSLTKQERECKLYDAFDKFTHIKGESLHNLPPEWSKFVTDVKLVKYLHTTKFDQLHAYLEQHELYANEVRLLHERNQDPLAFVANQQMTPPQFNTYQSSYNNPQLQQQFPPSQYGSIHPNQHYSSTYPSKP
ncbi:retrovirus-related pol polyprotein from transposon TNT 1-94 [Tanacetum coccineum]